MPKNLNEAETRFFLIDPALRDKGYGECWKLKLETPAPVDPAGAKGRRRGNGRTDYLLCVHLSDMPKPLPVAVIEAKSEGEDPLRGMEQAKSYSDCKRFSVQYVFASNGHRYGEFDKFTKLMGGPWPFKSFPTHEELTQRYAKDTGVDPRAPESVMLFTADSSGFSSKPRYYQDAAIRAAFEKIIRCEQNGEPARVLLSLATGSGKTVIAANLLYRLQQAKQLAKPALFLCDRDELREQAYSKLKIVFGDAVRMVESERGQNAARNARIHVATYQTLGIDDESGDASFLTEHYGKNAFSVIIIDECHRSAWGQWSEVLTRNPAAIHIGLTATPRQLRQSKKQTVQDAEITANNLAYFGEPVYEYTLIEAQEDGYLAACEIVRRKPSVDNRTFTDAQVLAANPVDARTGKAIAPEDLRPEYGARHFDDELLLSERIQAMCADLFKLLCKNGGPEQKVIVFCTRDAHADRVAIALNNLYVHWCREQRREPKDDYAFKCTAAGGSSMIEAMRGSGERCFIACTVDLLATGVDIERLNAVVFFRYLESPITFYQMVGRGTRIHEPTQKYKFWLYDYTGVTELFGTDFLTSDPTKRKSSKPDDDDDDNGGGEGPPIIEISGQQVEIQAKGRFILVRRDGRDVPIPVEEYRQELMQRVLREAKTLDEFRVVWIEAQKRRGLIDHLLSENYSPEVVRELADMGEYDLFDVFAHFGYRAAARTRNDRGGIYLTGNAQWFAAMPKRPAIVLRALGSQFQRGGTEALESARLFDVPDIHAAGGLAALAELGKPKEVMSEAKGRIFSV